MTEPIAQPAQPVQRRRRMLGLAVLGLALCSSALEAHDFWIEPSSWRPAPGQRVALRLRVGDHFPGDPVPRMPERIERFSIEGPGGGAAVEGVAGADPAGVAVAGAPGLYLVAYDSNHAAITLSGEKFEQHLAEQGLERVSELRRRNGQTGAAATEVYSRCAKALLAVGGGEAGYDRRLGLALELVPEKDPYHLAPGDELPVLLLYEGKPLEGALVEARSPATGQRAAGRTDAAGRVGLRLPRGPGGGFWLVKAVHMVPGPPGGAADWESLWASLTFEVGSGSASRPASR